MSLNFFSFKVNPTPVVVPPKPVVVLRPIEPIDRFLPKPVVTFSQPVIERILKDVLPPPISKTTTAATTAATIETL